MKPMPIRLRAVALLLPALLVASAGCDIVTAEYREQSTEEWRKTYELQAGGRVEISNVNGKIEVVKGDGNVVEIVARKKGRAASQEAAKQALERIQIVDSTSGGVIKVETKVDRSGGSLFNHSSAQVEYSLRVPANAELTLSTVNGAVEIAGINGRVTAEATNGGVIGRDLGGPVDASTTNGGIDVDFAAISGDVKLECTNGGVQIRLPKDAKATISARITNGGIDVQGVDLQTRGESSRRRLDADLNGGGVRIELEGTNGGIEIRGR
jgi:DUF4097 and DUF4098 domain-containing protein YvlB